MQKSFAKILSEKLNSEANSPLKSQYQDSATILEPSSLANLLGRMNPTHFKPAPQSLKAFARAYEAAQSIAAAKKAQSDRISSGSTNSEPTGQNQNDTAGSGPQKSSVKVTINEVKAASQPRRPKHSLTPLQTQSWAYFQDKTGLLNEFFESELKQAFHSLAKIMHPDRGGNPQLFRELKSHYDRLKILFY